MTNEQHITGKSIARFAICDGHGRPQSAFTLIEMLTVISIIGIIAALSVPVLKNFAKADVTISGSRQLVQDIGYARQLAIAQRTTVYMVFLPANFWNSPNWLSTVTTLNSQPAYANTLANLTNLLDKQLTGYTFLAYGALGDQPGRHNWHYLAPWQSLPQGTYIAPWKFNNSSTFTFNDPANPNYGFNINAFSTNNTFPFPTTNITTSVVTAADPAAVMPYLPYIAFNYLGQLCNFSGQLLMPNWQSGVGDGDFMGGGVDIPLAQGSIVPAIDVPSRNLLIGQPGIVENPPGNTTNISYNVVHIDPLTGRATLEYHKMQ